MGQYKPIEYVKLENGSLLTNKYISVFHEKHYEFNAPHHFVVEGSESKTPLCNIDFQCGPIKERGVNGVCNEDLINMCLVRLKAFQNSEFKCRENSIAITKLEEALLWLRKRTSDRELRNVESTHSV